MADDQDESDRGQARNDTGPYVPRAHDERLAALLSQVLANMSDAEHYRIVRKMLESVTRPGAEQLHVDFQGNNYDFFIGSRGDDSATVWFRDKSALMAFALSVARQTPSHAATPPPDKVAHRVVKLKWLRRLLLGERAQYSRAIVESHPGESIDNATTDVNTILNYLGPPPEPIGRRSGESNPLPAGVS